ncbi:hypothetical protein [Arthrobacter sp. zg-Y1110]|uniref:hypothetical protein n=1 Tax=Arthrobacter sp. zg-Y1110 TaxID=2886932 RepID=UPI001D14B39A|nr:hypothetical protein [Arthrobacter sp. zg-Y1110]MCC3292474.1 hypothetical protein [Arthrobacter sp. zg-Y1110]UWX87093.1 hypothetical protein N2K99_17230 [Arthrobacter sp. zg-Y1110]
MPKIIDKAAMPDAAAEVTGFLAGTGGCHRVSLPSRAAAVSAFADTLARTPAPKNPPRGRSEYEEAVLHLLNAGVLRLDEESHPCGACWAFTRAGA